MHVRRYPTMAKEAHIRINIATGKVRVTDENGKSVRKTRAKKSRTGSQRTKSIGTPTIFHSFDTQSEGNCVVIRIGGGEYKVCR
jgi:hypothetical protein